MCVCTYFQTYIYIYIHIHQLTVVHGKTNSGKPNAKHVQSLALSGFLVWVYHMKVIDRMIVSYSQCIIYRYTYTYTHICKYICVAETISNQRLINLCRARFSLSSYVLKQVQEIMVDGWVHVRRLPHCTNIVESLRTNMFSYQRSSKFMVNLEDTLQKITFELVNISPFLAKQCSHPHGSSGFPGDQAFE